MVERAIRAAWDVVQHNSQLLLEGFPVLGLPDTQRAVKYFSLNPFLPDAENRCPLECAYCVCHQDHEWHHHPARYASSAVSDTLIHTLLDHIFATPEGQQGFPISLCDYSDPFIPAHRERLLTILNALIDRDAANMVYITTKLHPGTRFLARLKETLERPNALRPTVFVSLPPLKPGYEEVSIKGRVRLLQDLVRIGIPCCWYLRPLVPEWVDEDLMWQLARELLPYVSHHVILSGVVMSPEIEEMLRARRLFVPEWDHAHPGRKQNLPLAFEMQLRRILSSVAEEQGLMLGPVMGHRLCGTNGNHAYGCLICAKQERYCQLFQLHHYGETIACEDNQRLKMHLREHAKQMQATITLAPLVPAPQTAE